MIGVSVVAVDDLGEEYSTSNTNYEGAYKLENLPDKAVIFIRVYKAVVFSVGVGVEASQMRCEKDFA
ncbi:hypothetical protein FACS1894188_11620 [Clostridia bacterium]|nr:hypothetical protein FACS1894188_11620 [Clostridia bacterium]